MIKYLKNGPHGKGIIPRVLEQVWGRFGPGTEAWDGHNVQIKHLQTGLRDVLDKWNTDNCGDPGAAVGFDV